MKCSNCGNEYPISSSYCPKCGENNPDFSSYKEEVKPTYQATNTQSNYQSQQSYQTPPTTNTTGVEEEANFGLAVLSFIIPLVGFILAAAYWTSKPKTASACLQASLWSVGLVIFVNLVF